MLESFWLHHSFHSGIIVWTNSVRGVMETTQCLIHLIRFHELCVTFFAREATASEAWAIESCTKKGPPEWAGGRPLFDETHHQGPKVIIHSVFEIHKHFLFLERSTIWSRSISTLIDATSVPEIQFVIFDISKLVHILMFRVFHQLESIIANVIDSGSQKEYSPAGKGIAKKWTKLWSKRALNHGRG